LLLISSFIFSAISKSAGCLGADEGAAGSGCFGIDFLMARDFAFDGDMLEFILEGDRGISGDTAFDDGAILNAARERSGT
jgi:hypothetical protein